MKRLIKRRDWIKAAAAGAAGLPLAGRGVEHPLAPRSTHFAPRARRVVFFFMNGGMSHVDSWDPKPALRELDGQKPSGASRKLKGSQWKPLVHKPSGIVTTDLVPHLNGVMDEISLVRSLHSDFGDHYEATLFMHTGDQGAAMPGIGAWLSYGLGTDNPNLPSHLVVSPREIYGGAKAWGSTFLPPIHQGTRIVPGDNPIKHSRPPAEVAKVQEPELDFLERLNHRHRIGREDSGDLAARMLSFRTAQSMQRQAPGIFDLSGEGKETRALYGLDEGKPHGFAWQCLMARRLAERGVRFIEVIDGGNWDNHSNIRNHGKLAANIDRPIAGLLRDLRARGLLDDTLVVFATEFGRTPWEDSNPTGRGHHRHAFTCWLAGGGVRGGHVHGASDDWGNKVAEDPVTIHDFHATILHLAGIDHERLTFRHAGRDFRLTNIYGNVIESVLA